MAEQLEILKCSQPLLNPHKNGVEARTWHLACSQQIGVSFRAVLLTMSKYKSIISPTFARIQNIHQSSVNALICAPVLPKWQMQANDYTTNK